jgi:hypothetical protein
MVTAAAIPRTAGTPNLLFRIGKTKTPRVALIFAKPAAKPARDEITYITGDSDRAEDNRGE